MQYPLSPEVKVEYC